MRPPDLRGQVLARSAERLRHKARASTAWDFERILLDEFPALFKVRAFPHLSADPDPRSLAAPEAPGRVLVAVVPAPDGAGDPLAAPRFDAATLERMTECLFRAASPRIRVTVRNAAYERVQARCVVRLARGVHPGEGLRRLGDAVSRFISAWTGPGRDFGWELRAGELRTILREVEGVEAVGGLSFLHMADNARGYHRIRDSAGGEGDGRAVWADAARPVLPWSLVLPTPAHLIEAVEEVGDGRPMATGFGRLEIGNTFIIRRAGHDE